MSQFRYTVDVLRVANGGDAVGKLPDGKTVFVRGALPGERIEIDLVEQKKSFARGKLRKIVTPSQDRVEPGCEHSARCGGCDYWHTSYENELSLKVNAAVDTLKRIARVELPEPVVHGAKSHTGWRTRATLTSDRRSGNLGFVARASRHVIDIEHCPVLSEELNAALTEIRNLPGSRAGRIFFESDGRGGVVLEGKQATEAWIRGRVHGVVGVGGKETVLATQSHHIAPDDFEVPAGRFRQGNTQMNHVLVQRVTELLRGSKRVLELYCGMGNFTASFADACDAVFATDVDAAAIETLDQLVSRMNLPVETRTCDLDAEFPDFQANTMLLDPPRTGAAFAAANVHQCGADRVVYVSCDVATLARDIGTLAGAGFSLSQLEFVDMFPRTAHIESIAVLTRQ
ncbi:MAG: TRAM domain-containing protein [bacterium]